MKNKNKGFTLVELLIVIGIIAILASAVIIAINPGQQFRQARNSTRWSHMNSLANAVYSSMVNNLEYPSGCPNTNGATTTVSTACTSLVTDGYINALPEDPLSEASYMIIFDDYPDNTRIKIWTTATEAADLILTQ